MNTTADTHGAVMQAEDLRRSANGLERAAFVLAEPRSEPATQRQRLSASSAWEVLQVIRTAASLKVGSEYGAVDTDTAIREGLVAIVRLAEYADVDFRDCLHEALFDYGCDLIDDGSGVIIPHDLIARSAELTRVLAERGCRTSPEEVTAVARRLQSAKVLELDHHELSLVEALRKEPRAMADMPLTEDGRPPHAGEGEN